MPKPLTLSLNLNSRDAKQAVALPRTASELLVKDAPWVLKVPLELTPELPLLLHLEFQLLLRDVTPESPGSLDSVDLTAVLSLARFRTPVDNGLTSRTVLLRTTTTSSETKITLETITPTVALSPELNLLACTNFRAVLTSKLNALLVDLHLLLLSASESKAAPPPSLRLLELLVLLPEAESLSPGTTALDKTLAPADTMSYGTMAVPTANSFLTEPLLLTRSLSMLRTTLAEASVSELSLNAPVDNRLLLFFRSVSLLFPALLCARSLPLDALPESLGTLPPLEVLLSQDTTSRFVEPTAAATLSPACADVISTPSLAPSPWHLFPNNLSTSVLEVLLPLDAQPLMPTASVPLLLLLQLACSNQHPLSTCLCLLARTVNRLKLLTID